MQRYEKLFNAINKNIQKSFIKINTYRNYKI